MPELVDLNVEGAPENFPLLVRIRLPVAKQSGGDAVYRKIVARGMTKRKPLMVGWRLLSARSFLPEENQQISHSFPSSTMLATSAFKFPHPSVSAIIYRDVVPRRIHIQKPGTC